MKRITALTGIVVAFVVAGAPTAAAAATPSDSVCQTVQQILFVRVGC